jgi:hypothetical protein
MLRTSKDSVMTKFAESPFYDVGCILASFWCEIGGEGLGMASVCFESVAHRFCPSPGSHLPGDGA